MGNVVRMINTIFLFSILCFREMKMELLTIIVVAMTCSLVSSDDYTLDLGLVVQGPEVDVLIEGNPVTYRQPYFGFDAPVNIITNGRTISVFEELVTKLTALEKAKFFKHNEQKPKNPLVRDAYEALRRMRSQARSAFQYIVRDKTLRKRGKTEMVITKQDHDNDPCLTFPLRVKYNEELETGYKIIASITTDHNAFLATFDDEEADGVTTYKTTSTAAVVKSKGRVIANDLIQASVLMDTTLENVREYLEWVETAINNEVHPAVLSALRFNTGCHNQTELEEMRVSHVEQHTNGVMVNYTARPYTKVEGHFELYAVPYMVGDSPYAVELHDSVVVDQNSGKVLDHSKCIKAGHTYRCVGDYLMSDTCIQHALDTITEIPDECEITKLDADPTPMIVTTALGTLIAQRSPHPVLISHGARRIREDPVIIRGPEKLIVAFARGRKVVEGQANVTFAVHASPLDEEARKTLYYRHGINYVYKMIPDSYSDFLYLSLATGQLVLLVPILWSLYKYCLRCCGHNWDTRPPGWLRAAREWERPLRKAYSRRPTVPMEEDIPLQNMQRSSGSGNNYFLTLARDAKQLSLNEFLDKYQGDQNDLTNFYERVNAGNSSSRRGVRFV